MANAPATRSPGALTEDEALEIISYLVSSAETSLTEPAHYPIFRLIDATSRMMGLMLEGHDLPKTREFVERFKAEVDQKKVWMMWDFPAFLDFVRTAPATVAAEARRQADESGAKGGAA